MDAKKHVEVQNIMGRFMHFWYENRLDACAALFSREDGAQLVIPERGVHACGPDQICQSLKEIQDRREGWGMYRDIHLTHSPGFRENGDGTVSGAWDTLSIEPGRRDGWLTGTIEYYLTRINCTFVPRDGKMRLIRLHWRELQGMIPWAWKRGMWESAKDRPEEQIPEEAPVLPQDYYALRNLTTLFSQWNRVDCGQFFAPGEDTLLSNPELLEQDAVGYEGVLAALAEAEARERKNQGMYLCVPYLGSPVVWAQGDRAQVFWICMTVGFRGSAYGLTRETARTVRTIGRLHVDLVRLEGGWRIQKYRYTPAIGFDPLPYQPSDRYNRMDAEAETWRPGPALLGEHHPEDVAEIENLVAEWVYGQRYKFDQAFVDAHMDVKTKVPYALITGSTRIPTVGLEDLRKRLGRNGKVDEEFVFDNENHTPGYHTCSTPFVQISPDGTYAVGAWLDFASVDLGGCMGLEKFPKRYMITFGRYFHEFIKEDGKWKQFGVGWDPLASLPDMLYDPAHSRGYFCHVKEFVFPEMFEDIG